MAFEQFVNDNNNDNSINPFSSDDDDDNTTNLLLNLLSKADDKLSTFALVIFNQTRRSRIYVILL